MKPICWFMKGWDAGDKSGKWTFSKTFAGIVAAFGYWTRKKSRREKTDIDFLSETEVERMAGWVRPKPRGIIVNKSRSL